MAKASAPVSVCALAAAGTLTVAVLLGLGAADVFNRVEVDALEARGPLLDDEGEATGVGGVGSPEAPPLHAEAPSSAAARPTATDH